MLDLPDGPQDIATLSGPFALKFELARRIVARFHGWAEANLAAEEWMQVVSLKQAPKDAPTVVVEHACPAYLPALFLEQGLVSSKSEARRLLKQGAVRLNGEQIDPPDGIVYFWGPYEHIRVGKRRHLHVLPRYGKEPAGHA